MGYFKHRSAHCKAWSLWALFVLLSALAFALYLGQSYRQIHAEAEQHLLRLSHDKRKALEQQLNEAVHTLQQAVALAKVESSRPKNPQAMGSRFAALLQKSPSVSTLLMMDADGNATASNRSSLLGNNFKNSERYKAITSNPGTDKVYLSEPFVTPMGKFTFSLGAMVPDQDGQFGGYVLAIISPTAVIDTLQKDTASHDVAVALVHDSGKVIFRVPDSDDRIANDLRDYPEAIFWTFLKSGADEQLQTATPPNTGLSNLLSYQRVKLDANHLDHSVFIGMGIEHQSLLAEWRITRLELFVAWLLLACFSAGLTMWKTRTSTHD